MSYLKIPVTPKNYDKIQRIIKILLEPEPDSVCSSPDDKYFHIHNYRIKKPGKDCGGSREAKE